MKRVLINWYYHRFDLTEYLLRFSKEMEIVFLYQQFPVQEPAYITTHKNVSVIYWGDFASPYALLKKVNPDVVVFSDLESFNQIALNIAARNKKIKTFVLQHGFRGDYEIEEALNAGNLETKIEFSNTSLWSFRFLLSALKAKNLSQLPQLLKFIVSRKKLELTTALFKNQFELRRADYYIEFSKENAGYHRKRDGVPEERFILTGNPLFDDYFDELNNKRENKSQPYALLIDCPFVEANFYKNHGVDAARKNEYLQKLDNWSESNGLAFKVKLHPLTYKAAHLYESSNIEYYRDETLKTLVADASVVYFVHFSSLAPVIISAKPSIYFQIEVEQFGNIFQRLGVPTLPLFQFDVTKPNIWDIARKADKETLMPLLFATDGKAQQRIKASLSAAL